MSDQVEKPRRKFLDVYFLDVRLQIYSSGKVECEKILLWVA